MLVFMPKTITIRTDVYNDLVKVKKSDESFSELFERLIKSATPIETLRKMRGSVEFRNKKKMMSDIYSKRSAMRYWYR